MAGAQDAEHSFVYTTEKVTVTSTSTTSTTTTTTTSTTSENLISEGMSLLIRSTSNFTYST